MDNLKLSDLIEAKFSECLKKDIHFTPIYFPHIPDARQTKAEKGFVKYKYDNETMIMLFDTSLFERGKNGMVFTNKAVYFKDMIGDTCVCKYSDWRRDRDDLGKIFNLTEDNAFFLVPFLNNLMNEISIMIEYEGESEDENAVNSGNETVDESTKDSKDEISEEESSSEPKKTSEKKTSEKKSSKKKSSEKKASTSKKKGVSQSTAETVLDIADIVLDVLQDPL